MFRLDFVALLVSFKSSLCILVTVLHQMSFASIFLQFVTCLLILLILSFGEQRFLILMKSSLSIISLMELVFDVISKKASLYLGRFPFMSLCSSELWLVIFFYLSYWVLLSFMDPRRVVAFSVCSLFFLKLFSVQTKGWSGKFQTLYMKNRKPEVSQFSEFFKNLFIF